MKRAEVVKNSDKKIVICISGMAGTGKSTLAKRLARKYRLHYYSGGDALKELAGAEGCNVSVNGWWETSEGLRFLERRRNDSKFDKAVDNKLLEYAKQGNVLLDSWTMPWLLNKGFKIWLSASLEKRAERIVKRDKISPKEAIDVLREKEGNTETIYKKLYGFTLGKDFEPFHFILDTDNLNANEVYHVLCDVIDNLVFNNTN
jgi:cytidylate kinase